MSDISSQLIDLNIDLRDFIMAAEKNGNDHVSIPLDTVELWNEIVNSVFTDVEALRDEMANREYNLLKQFDEDAAEHTDLYTYVSCLKAYNECLKMKNDELRSALIECLRKYADLMENNNA